jgi:hypothetical protein
MDIYVILVQILGNFFGIEGKWRNHARAPVLISQKKNKMCSSTFKTKPIHIENCISSHP